MRLLSASVCNVGMVAFTVLVLAPRRMPVDAWSLLRVVCDGRCYLSRWLLVSVLEMDAAGSAVLAAILRDSAPLPAADAKREFGSAYVCQWVMRMLYLLAISGIIT